MRIFTATMFSALAILISLPAAADWPMLQNGPEHTGYTSSPGPDVLNVLWEWEYETPNEVYFYRNAAVVADGRVYAIVNEVWWSSPYNTTSAGQLVCLDASRGGELWRYEAPYNREIEGYPAVDHGRVYFTVTTRPTYGGYEPISTLYCLDAVTGSTIWTWDPRILESDMGPPVVADGVLYITETYGYYWGSDYDCTLYALDAGTGSLLWGVTVDGRYREFIQPSIHQGRVYAGWQDTNSSDGAIFCLDALTGDSIWYRAMAPLYYTEPTVAGDKVLYHLYGDVLVALDAETGSTQWEQPGSTAKTAADVAGNKVFNVDDTGHVSCYELDSGEVQWTSSAVIVTYYAGPSVAGDRLYISSRGSTPANNYLYCFDTVTGDQLWSPSTPIKGCAPAISDGKIYISDDLDGRVLCIGREGTVDASLTCEPSSGTLPFASQFEVSMTNAYTGLSRRLFYDITVTLANGQNFPHWRQGWQNVSADQTFIKNWWQTIPGYVSVIGTNQFDLFVLDVTPAPYNLPPYPPAGDTAVDQCTITASEAP